MNMVEQFQRQTAFRVWISDLNNENFIKQEGEFVPNYIKVENKNVSRVNLIGSVVNKYENQDSSYNSLLLDDGSAQIRVKTWREDTILLQNFEIGDIILVIGKVKEYNNEIYVLPEIVKKLNVNWQLVRRLKLIKEYGKPKQQDLIHEIKEQEKEELSGDAPSVSWLGVPRPRASVSMRGRAVNPSQQLPAPVRQGGGGRGSAGNGAQGPALNH